MGLVMLKLEKIKASRLHLPRLITFCLLILFPLASQAETLYVADNLRVGIRSTASSKAPSIAIISTGTAVTVLQRKKQFLKIKTPNGVEGWVKSAYFSNNKPAKLQLEEAKKQLKRLELDLETLKSQQPEAKQQIDQLSGQLASLTQQNATLKQQLQQQPRGNRQAVSLMNLPENKKPLLIFAMVILGTLGFGFLFGVLWYRRVVTKRLGGITL